MAYVKVDAVRGEVSEPVTSLRGVPLPDTHGSHSVTDAWSLNARQAQLLLEKLQTAEAALEEERHLSGREREVMSERLRFAQSEDEAARDRLARALSSLRHRAHNGAVEVAEHQQRAEESIQRLQDECRQLQASQQHSEHEAAGLRHVQREQQAQLAFVTAERERLNEEVKVLRVESRDFEVEAQKERKLKDEMSERVSQWRLRADAESEEKDRVMKALAGACKQHDEQVSKLNGELALNNSRHMEMPGLNDSLQDRLRSRSPGKSPPSLQASPDIKPPQMLELRCQELQSRLERALLQADASRQRTLELELQLECERGDSRAHHVHQGSVVAGIPSLPIPPTPGPPHVSSDQELRRKTANMEAEVNAARAQAHAAKLAEESALEALSDSERRCRDGLRRMDAMLADTKELTRELAKHKYLAQGMDSIVRRHEARMLRPSPESRGSSTPLAASRRADFGRFTSPRMIREPVTIERGAGPVIGRGEVSALQTSFLSDPGTSRFGRSPSPKRSVLAPDIEPRNSPSRWRSQASPLAFPAASPGAQGLLSASRGPVRAVHA